ncbi:MAG: ImmA/IrrE family metallo-endopeptidase [Firmicutes bacterium]|nr:ImmA/IrrE family metallo-endopeptidase [Bacillota bacterium]
MMEKIEINSNAISLRKKFSIDNYTPVDIFSLANSSEDLTLVFYPMGERISGICIKDNRNRIIGINSSMTYGRQRFTVAHELCHLYFHEDFMHIVCSKDLERDKDLLEKEADMFASYFLAPYEALNAFINSLGKSKGKSTLSVTDVVKIEQHFGVSRQAILWRLSIEGYVDSKTAEPMKSNIISSAIKLGFDDRLYRPTPEHKQYTTQGKYIKLAETLKDRGLISTGKYEELLLNGFRGDMVFGFEEEEAYD